MINNLIKKLPVVLILSCINTAVIFSQYVGQFSSVQAIKPQIQVKAYSFDLSDIKLLDSRFKENMERDGKWLLSIDNKQLLHSWRVNAGMSTNGR